MSFEEMLQALEKIVNELENKEIDLDEAINKYNKALELSKGCYEKLKSAELIVKVDEDERN